MTADTKPNHTIREVREAQFRMSRGEFAQHINATAAQMGENTGCTSRLIAAWERGEVASPRPVYERILHDLTGRTLTDLGFAPRRAAGSSCRGQRGEVACGGAGAVVLQDADTSCTLDDMIRREFLRLVSVTGAYTTFAQPVEPEGDAERVRGEPMKPRALNTHLWSVYGLTSAKQSVYPMVQEQLGSLTTALRQAGSPAEHSELCHLVGDVAQLAGEIWFDANRYTEAAHCYTLAADAAKEAGDRDLWACVLVRHAFVSIHARRHGEALPLLDAAASLARDGDSSLPTRHWAASVRAQTLAGLGDAEGCRRALDEAEGVRDLGSIAPRGWLRFTGDRMAEERGSAYASLGRLDDAEEVLTGVLRGGLSPRRRGSVLTDLAMIGAGGKDVDRLVAHGTEAVKLARSTGSGYIASRLQDLRDHLSPYPYDRRVRELTDAIETLGVRS